MAILIHCSACKRYFSRKKVRANDSNCLKCDTSLARSRKFWVNVKLEAQQQLAKYSEEISRKGIEVETVVREGYPATVIEEEAARQNVDLIVIGTRGLSGIKHLLLGSIAERVVQKAPCPVLTVKLPDSEES